MSVNLFLEHKNYEKKAPPYMERLQKDQQLVRAISCFIYQPHHKPCMQYNTVSFTFPTARKPNFCTPFPSPLPVSVIQYFSLASEQWLFSATEKA